MTQPPTDPNKPANKSDDPPANGGNIGQQNANQNERLLIGRPQLVVDPWTKERRLIMPIYLQDGEKQIFVGYYDVNGEFVERLIKRADGTYDRYRVSMATLTKEGNRTWWFFWWGTTKDWDAWFKKNNVENAAVGANMQHRIELLKELQVGKSVEGLRDRMTTEGDTMKLLATIDVLFYDLVFGLAQPSGAIEAVQIITQVKRGTTVSANAQRGVIEANLAARLGGQGEAVITASQLYDGKMIGQAGEKILEQVLKNRGNVKEVFALKNAADNGIDLIAKMHDGSYVFFEVKTSGRVVAPAMSAEQAMGAQHFVSSRLRDMANRAGRYTGISEAQAKAADELLKAINANGGTVTGHLVEITNLGLPTQSINIRPW